MSEADILSSINYQKLFEAVSGFYIVLTNDFKIVAVTDAFLKKFFKTKNQILGQYIFDIFYNSSDGALNLTESLNKVLTEKSTQNINNLKYDILLPDGSIETKYWKAENSPIFNENGEVIYIIHRTEDITEFISFKEQENKQIEIHQSLQIKSNNMEEEFNQIAHELKSGKLNGQETDISVKQAIRELEAERAKLHNLLSNAPAYISLLESPEHIFTFTNPPYQKLINDRQVIGKTIREAWPELEGQGFFELLDGVYNTGIAFIGNETPAIIDHGNGITEQRYMNFVYQPVFDINNQVSGISAYVYDVTELVVARQKSEVLTKELSDSETKYKSLSESLELEVQTRTAQLKSEQEKLNNLFMNAPAIISVTQGPEHKYTLSNPLHKKLFGYRDILDKPIREALPELKNQGVFEVLDQVYKTEIPHFASEFPALIKQNNGVMEKAYFNIVYQPVFDINKHIEAISIFAFDVTEQVLARHQVEQLNKQLSVSEAKYRSLAESLELKVQERTLELFTARARYFVLANILN